MGRRPVSATFSGRRLRRRQLIAAAGLGSAAVSTSAIACSTQKKPASSTAGQSAASSGSAKQPKRGGVLNYAGGIGSQDTGGRPLDPNTQTQGGAKSYMLFYERLVAYDLLTYVVQPELAQKWEQPSSTEYVFTLQPAVKWQNKPPVNGRPMTADDVLFSLERARSDDPKFLSRSLLDQIDKIQAPDKGTIKVTTKGPDSSTLKRLATDQLAIMPREAVEKNPVPTTADAVVGTGPFMMKSIQEKVGAEYVRNPGYWKPDLPYLDGFRTRHFNDLQTAWSALLAGQIDVSLVDGAAAKTYIAKQGPGFKPGWAADDTINAFMIPNVKTKPLNDARVTRALRLLTDHDEFISAWAETTYGRGAHGSSFPTALSDWDLTQDEYKTHLEWKQPKDEAAKEALALLNAAGFTKQNTARFAIMTTAGNPQMTLGCQLMQAQWKRLSQGVVDVEISELQPTVYTAARANRTFAYGFIGHSAGPVEPDIWLSTTYRTGGSLNFMDFSDPQLDAMIDKQRAIFDEKQRKAAIKEIVLYMIDHAPSTIGAEVYFLHAVQPKVQGYQPETHFLNGRDFKSVWLEG